MNRQLARRRCGLLVCVISMLFGFSLAGPSAMGAEVMALPKPQMQGGMPLMQAMKYRKAQRKFSDKPLEAQDLSNILWAAFGVNREDGRRTVATARNLQDAEVLAAMKSGIWSYDARENTLVKRLDQDLTRDLGGAPLTLIYTGKEGPFAGMHAGSMYQNVGLYCASRGLANVVKRQGVREVSMVQTSLGLPADYVILIVQSVGWPGE